MNFAIILLPSLIALVITRIPFTLIYNSQKEEQKPFERILLSFGILGSYIVIWAVIVQLYMNVKQVDDNLLWYCIFTYFGVVSIIWCYLRWDLKWKAIPKFEENKMLVALKKTVVFVIVMLFAFYHGYKQMDAAFRNLKVDDVLVVYNVTMISGIIALDRVLNQIAIVYNEWKEKQKKKTIKTND